MLEVSELFHRFGERVAVDRLSFAVDRGEIVGLVGRNGAGKTTTMRSVVGIVAPLGGTIRWDGHAIGMTDRLRFGYLPEERGLYPQMQAAQALPRHGRGGRRDRTAANARRGVFRCLHARRWQLRVLS
jgi:ABC-2 type transport system ATP-binding protein